MGCPRARPRRDRGDPVRRLGTRRPDAARRTDGPPPARRPPHRVGQPAEGDVWVRASGPRDGGGVAVRRRLRRGPFTRLTGTTRRTRRSAGMKDLLDDIDRWRRNGKRVAVARVVDVEGSGPRDPGAAMVVSDDREVAGSVSGGCVEGAVVTEALEVLESGERKIVTFGYSDDEAFAVGLTCGGTIHLFIQPLDWA